MPSLFGQGHKPRHRFIYKATLHEHSSHEHPPSTPTITMLIDSNIRDQAYQFFTQESLEFLQILETGLLTLQQEHDIPVIHSLMRAAHSIKGGAASVGLEAIKKIAHQLEDVLRALYKDGVVIDAELEDLLLQAYDCLRTPLIQQIQTGESTDAEHWLEQSEVIFAQLVEKLGDAMFGESELPTAAELGIDIVLMIFSGDVEEGLLRLESVLSDSNHPEIAGELRAQAQVFIGVGELVNLAGFVSIAKTAEAAIDRHPEQARAIVETAVKDFRVAQKAVLEGDRTSGGEPSPTLTAWLADEMPADGLLTDNASAAVMDLSMWVTDDDDEDLDFAILTTGAAISKELEPSDPSEEAVSGWRESIDSDSLPDIAIDFSDNSLDPAFANSAFVDLESIADADGDGLSTELTSDDAISKSIPEAWNANHADILRDTLSDTPIDVEPDLLDTLTIDLAHQSVSISLSEEEDDDDDDDELPNWENCQPLSFDDFETSEAEIEEVSSQLEPTVSIELENVEMTVEAEVNETDEAVVETAIEPEVELTAKPSATEPFVTGLASGLANALLDVSDMMDLSEMMSDVSGDLSEASWPVTLELSSVPETVTGTFDVSSDVALNADVAGPPVDHSLSQTLKAAIAAPENPEMDDDIPTQLLAPINSAKLKNAESTTPKAAPRSQSAADAPMLSNSIRVDLSRLDRLNNLVGEMVSQENSAILQNQQLKDILITVLQRVGRFDRLTKELRNWLDGSQTVRSQLSGYQSALAPEPSVLSSQFDPLQMDDYSDLSVLMQETIDEVAQIGEAMRDMTLLSHHSQQTQRLKQQTLRQVRNDLLWARMLPIGDILQRFPRMIRDMAHKYSKTVTVKLTGTNTLVDKAMLEKLYDPLVHLVRNGFDHGIEPPEQREVLGKPKEATIEIRAFHRGSQIYIEVIDDGRGIDTEKVLAKAVSKQIITAEEAENLSRDQIYDLLFAPGFSTADIVSDLSGRGVGLDTVRSQIKSLKGGLNISSEPGKGTTFTLRLPLTLTITKLLVFSIQSRLMAVPVDSLIAIVAAPNDQIQTLKHGKFYHWQEQFIPIYPQSIFSQHYALKNQSFEQPNSLTLPTKDKVPLLMLAGDAQTIALPVDTILYEQELAIKPFSKTITPPPYLYGCTLLGDGSLVPVLDAQMLIATKQAEIVTHKQVKAKIPVESAAKNSTKNTTILVIDDSLTTRQTLAAVLQKAGYRILQARDGREALEQLNQAPEIQAAFCDIEMPKMNGFEFLNACRQERSKEILPVVMLSSRSNEKHRQVAKYMGANEYMTKPFFEHELLKTLGDLLTERSKHIAATQATPSEPTLALAFTD